MHICNGVPLSHKRTNQCHLQQHMPLEIIILSEVHRRKDKYHTILLYMASLKYDTNKLIYKKYSDIENRLVVLKRGGGCLWDGVGVWGQQM